jgi:hypothetical protein
MSGLAAISPPLVPDVAAPRAPGADTAPAGRAVRTPSPLDAAWRDLAVFTAGITPARIVGEADAADALALRDDLDLIWQRVDRLIEAYGDYAASHFNGIDTGLFKDQLRGALEGNATFELEEAAGRLRAARTEARPPRPRWD